MIKDRQDTNTASSWYKGYRQSRRNEASVRVFLAKKKGENLCLCLEILWMNRQKYMTYET